MGDSTHTNRRTVLRTIGSLGLAGALVSSAGAREGSAAAGADCAGHGARPDRPPQPTPETGARALATHPDRYLAVVDRIVDGRHAVLLLEDGDEVVDQLVVSPDDLPAIEERDVLLVTLTDDELASARRLDGETERRKRDLEDRFDSLAE